MGSEQGASARRVRQDHRGSRKLRTRSGQRCRRVVALALLVSLPWITGCDGLFYALHVAEGHFSVQGQTEPIDAVLASGRLSEEKEEKLRLIVKVCQFAGATIGLNVGDSYTTFYDTSGDPLAFNLSAARRDALIPYTWAFPIIGEVPYLAFLDEEYMHEVERDLIDGGYDTYTYELDAYSTLGVFADPVRSTMLRRGTLSLVETIIHELLHNTVWRANETVFNESLATFVGRRGAVEFLRVEYGDTSGWPELAEAYYADTDAVNAFLFELYHELEAFYAQGLSPEEKIAGREAVYQAGRDRFVDEVLPALNYPDVFAGYSALPTNNAWMLGNYRYNLDLAVFEAVYAAVGESWPAALEVFRAAATGPGDPFEFLETWLSQQDN
jgi:predicted aminopeptidase